MNEANYSPTARSASEAAHPEGRPAAPSTRVAGPSGWTAGRITALVIGGVLALVSLGLLGCGATALWVDRTQRDAAGYITTNVHEFSATGSALATEPIDLGSAGTGWLYAPTMLDRVRIEVTPADPGTALFVGIGPSTEVDRYLAGVRHTLISDFWGNNVQTIDGGTPASAPGTQDFWVASTTGPGARTVTWDPANGSWTVVVMNADGRPGIDMGTDLGARMPALPWIALSLLGAGVIFAVGGALLLVGTVRHASRARTA